MMFLAVLRLCYSRFTPPPPREATRMMQLPDAPPLPLPLLYLLYSYLHDMLLLPSHSLTLQCISHLIDINNELKMMDAILEIAD